MCEIEGLEPADQESERGGISRSLRQRLATPGGALRMAFGAEVGLAHPVARDSDLQRRAPIGLNRSEAHHALIRQSRIA